MSEEEVFSELQRVLQDDTQTVQPTWQTSWFTLFCVNTTSWQHLQVKTEKGLGRPGTRLGWVSSQVEEADAALFLCWVLSRKMNTMKAAKSHAKDGGAQVHLLRPVLFDKQHFCLRAHSLKPLSKHLTELLAGGSPTSLPSHGQQRFVFLSFKLWTWLKTFKFHRKQLQKCCRDLKPILNPSPFNALYSRICN